MQLSTGKYVIGSRGHITREVKIKGTTFYSSKDFENLPVQLPDFQHMAGSFHKEH